MILFAEKFRGYQDIDIPIEDVGFLVGDNSSGKTSIIHLISYVMNSDLIGTPALDSDYSVGRFDFFSPYFDYEDVVIGFATQFNRPEISEFAGKIVTLRRRPNGQPPEVIKFSMFDDISSASIRLKGKGLQFKIDRNDKFGDLTSFKDHCRDFHRQTTGFKAAGEKYSGSGVNSFVDVFTTFSSAGSKNGDRQFVAGAMRPYLPETRHSGPVRGLPERFYQFERTYKPSGSHFASMWQDLSEDHAEEFQEIIGKFGENSGLFDEVVVRKLSKGLDLSPLYVRVRKGGKLLDLNQVGVGISQVIPIIVEALFVRFDATNYHLLLQQPELHLHPIAQAALGDFVYEMSLKGVRLTIETHSDYLIDRFRYRLRQDSKKNDEKLKLNTTPKILFCENTDNGNVCHEIDIQNDGTIDNTPESYKQFFVNEALRTMF